MVHFNYSQYFIIHDHVYSGEKIGGCSPFPVTNSRSGFTLALFKVCLGELNKPIYSEVPGRHRGVGGPVQPTRIVALTLKACCFDLYLFGPLPARPITRPCI